MTLTLINPHPNLNLNPHHQYAKLQLIWHQSSRSRPRSRLPHMRFRPANPLAFIFRLISSFISSSASAFFLCSLSRNDRNGGGAPGGNGAGTGGGENGAGDSSGAGGGDAGGAGGGDAGGSGGDDAGAGDGSALTFCSSAACCASQL